LEGSSFGLIKVISRHYPRGAEEYHEKPQQESCVEAAVRTAHISNINLERYNQTNRFGMLFYGKTLKGSLSSCLQAPSHSTKRLGIFGECSGYRFANRGRCGDASVSYCEHFL
jgi:hypothetical protein